jgi:mono/diheme cytochrome c family protein
MSRFGAIAVTMLLAGAGCSRAAPANDLQTFDPGQTPPEFSEGEQQYEVRCAACHGRHAKGTDRGPPLIDRIYRPSHHADESFQRAVAFGVQAHHWDFGPMQPISGVGREDVARITGYVRWLQRQAGVD